MAPWGFGLALPFSVLVLCRHAYNTRLGLLFLPGSQVGTLAL